MALLKQIAPNENINVELTNDSFILSGQVSNSVVLEEIQKLAAAYGYRDKNFINVTETPDAQVMLEVKIAEAQRSDGLSILPTWSLNRQQFSSTHLGNVLSTTLTPAGSSTSSTPVTPASVPLNPALAVIGATVTATGLPVVNQVTAANVGSQMMTFTPTKWFDAAFEALESVGKATILAEPTLVCTHGRTADFLAGGEAPYVGGVDQTAARLFRSNSSVSS